MSGSNALQRMIAQRPRAATAAYGVLIVVFCAAAFISTADLLNRYDELNALTAALARMEGRNPPAAKSTEVDVSPTGSPVLEGPTVTVAGAALLQRVSDAVTKVGGNVLSSQVDLQGAQAKNGFIGVTINSELDQPALQRLLYDLEAGMPFLFVDQLVAQAPVASATGGEGRMRIMLAVSGQWQGKR